MGRHRGERSHGNGRSEFFRETAHGHGTTIARAPHATNRGNARRSGPFEKRSVVDVFIAKCSPHLFADAIKTPTLVITNEQDFRVPVDQGLQLFTALQRQGVPSRLVMFPDEGHWIAKPQNQRF